MTRITLSLDDDVYKLIQRYAHSRSLRVGQAVSELVRRGFQADVPLRREGELIVFDLPRDAAPVSSEDVARSDKLP